jgi:hypothetical protein
VIAVELEAVLRSLVAELVAAEVKRTLAESKPIALEITIDAYAAARSISPSTVRAAISAGRLPAIRYGRAVRVPANVEIGTRASVVAPIENDELFARRVLRRGK